MGYQAGRCGPCGQKNICDIRRLNPSLFSRLRHALCLIGLDDNLMCQFNWLKGLCLMSLWPGIDHIALLVL